MFLLDTIPPRKCAAPACVLPARSKRADYCESCQREAHRKASREWHRREALRGALQQGNGR